MFNQDTPMNTDFFPDTNLAGWRTSILCPSIHAFLPIDTDPGNYKAPLQHTQKDLENIADTTWESQGSISELTFITSCLSLSEDSNLQSKFDWEFYSKLESFGM